MRWRHRYEKCFCLLWYSAPNANDENTFLSLFFVRAFPGTKYILSQLIWWHFGMYTVFAFTWKIFGHVPTTEIVINCNCIYLMAFRYLGFVFTPWKRFDHVQQNCNLFNSWCKICWLSSQHTPAHVISWCLGMFHSYVHRVRNLPRLIESA
jgi:hypothetical protein